MMDKKNDVFVNFCNECDWKEETIGLQYEFCPKCGHVNIGFSWIGKQKQMEVANDGKRHCSWTS